MLNQPRLPCAHQQRMADIAGHSLQPNYVVPLIGFALAVIPHLMGGVWSKPTAGLPAAAATISKIFAPLLIFTGFALQLPSSGWSGRPPRSVLLLFCLGIAAMVAKALWHVVSRPHALELNDAIARVDSLLNKVVLIALAIHQPLNSRRELPTQALDIHVRVDIGTALPQALSKSSWRFLPALGRQCLHQAVTAIPCTSSWQNKAG